METTTTSFAELGVAGDLVDALDAAGITEPFAVQRLTIPDVLSGNDVCGKAQTGSGKTLAFGLPMVQMMGDVGRSRPHGLILVPTRELANQVAEVLEPLLAVRGATLVAVYGGAPMGQQVSALRKGASLVVATPGRLIDLIDRGDIDLGEITMVTIDEADQMADMGFLPQVRRIMREVPEKHQTLLFSATLDGQVGTLVKAYMKDPVRHEVETNTQTVDTSEHRFLKVHHMDKPKVAAAIARSSGRTLMFVRTKSMCDRLTEMLKELDVDARAIHGDLHQRHREKSLDRFSDGSASVLVATNVAARGLHIDDVDIVIHYDPPDDPKTYLHRSGRTARAGETGLVVTLVEWDQVNEVLKIQRRAGLNAPIIKMFSNDDRLTDLTSWEPPEEMAPFKSTRRRRF